MSAFAFHSASGEDVHDHKGGHLCDKAHKQENEHAVSRTHTLSSSGCVKHRPVDNEPQRWGQVKEAQVTSEIPQH